MDDREREQHRECGGEQHRLGDVLLHQPPVVDDAEDGDRVDEECSCCQAFRRDAGSSRGSTWPERDQKQERAEAEGDERSLDHVLDDRAEIEELVERKVRGEVQAGVEEGEQAQHAPHANEPVPAGDPAQRRDDSVISSNDSVQVPVERVTNSIGFTPRPPVNAATTRRARGASARTNSAALIRAIALADGTKANRRPLR